MLEAGEDPLYIARRLVRSPPRTSATPQLVLVYFVSWSTCATRRSRTRSLKDDVREVEAGFEQVCGLSIRNFNEIQQKDHLEVYEVVEVARTL